MPSTRCRACPRRPHPGSRPPPNHELSASVPPSDSEAGAHHRRGICRSPPRRWRPFPTVGPVRPQGSELRANTDFLRQPLGNPGPLPPEGSWQCPGGYTPMSLPCQENLPLTPLCLPLTRQRNKDRSRQCKETPNKGPDAAGLGGGRVAWQGQRGSWAPLPSSPLRDGVTVPVPTPPTPPPPALSGPGDTMVPMTDQSQPAGRQTQPLGTRKCPAESSLDPGLQLLAQSPWPQGPPVSEAGGTGSGRRVRALG